MTTGIVKHQPEPDIDAFILALWLMFCRCPRRPEPDFDGHYDLGDIGSTVEKNWHRLTPYSVAKLKEPQ
jgi:hypothetical protein